MSTLVQIPNVSTEEFQQDIRDKVRAGYIQVALAEKKSCCGPSCGSTGSEDTATQLAQSLGYSADELSSLPEGANLGLSCGNPVALATLKEGEVVVDLGSGGGFDIFIAGRKVGPTGRAIGVDMTPEMISRARRNILQYRRLTGWNNVEFRLGEIEHLPLPDNSVDVIISNCVINLSPNKPQVWREIARVLRTGGRAAVTDISRIKAIPKVIQDKVEALVGCISGASLIEEVRQMIEAAGLVDIQLSGRPEVVDAASNANDPLNQEFIACMSPGEKISDYITSLSISARKPE